MTNKEEKLGKLKEVLDKRLGKKEEDINAGDLADVPEVKMRKPGWYKDPAEIVAVRGVVKVEQDQSGMMSFITGAIQAVVSFLGELQKKTFTIRKEDAEYLKPQYVAIFDPYTGKVARLEDFMGKGPGGGSMNLSVQGGGIGAITIRGATSLRGGTATVSVAGTRVQLPNIPCNSVLIQAHEDNATLNLTTAVAIVVGGSDVVASSASRNGYAVYPTQSQVFNVDNLNRLYVDATDSGAKVTYIIQA